MGWKIRCLGCEGNLYRVRVESGPLGDRSVIIECAGCGHEWCPGVAANNETWWWKAPGERHGQDVDGDQAVGRVGDVAAHMVSATQGRARVTEEEKRAATAARQRRYRERKRLKEEKG